MRLLSAPGKSSNAIQETGISNHLVVNPLVQIQCDVRECSIFGTSAAFAYPNNLACLTRKDPFGDKCGQARQRAEMWRATELDVPTAGPHLCLVLEMPEQPDVLHP